MFHVILVCPEIPPNTGNAIRLCANTGAQLHLVRPLGFELDDARMRLATMVAAGAGARHAGRGAGRHGRGARRHHALTTHAQRSVADVAFKPGDVFVFGRESAGLSDAHHALFPQQRLRLPCAPGSAA